MRVVVLTHWEDRHCYFANRLIEETGAVVGVVTGAKDAPATARRLTGRALYIRTRNRALNLTFRKWLRALEREKRTEELSAFAGARAKFLDRHARLRIAHVGEEYASINDPALVARIREQRPDVIAVMGTALVKDGILGSAAHIINMHTGLAPYYRGGYTNLWPIIENDPGYFGVTIHTMSPGIDSGDIIYTARPEVAPDDNFSRVNCRCIELGTGLMVQALGQVQKGTLGSVAQWTRGKLFFDRDMNGWVAYRYFLGRRRFFAEHYRLAQSAALPQPRLITNGRS
jgi:folate-dependent phosphoribosylglycinamide formyltransferase PurN